MDIIAQNQTISKFQAQNTEAYRFIYEFAVHCIREFGDENDDTVFGEGITLEDGTEVDQLGITVGKIVKAFKDAKNLKIEIDTKNGYVTNPLLELRSIQRLLAVAPQGSPMQSKLLEALARVEGHSMGANSVQAPQGTGAPQELNVQALTQELNA